jgi:hypothetical protein
MAWLAGSGLAWLPAHARDVAGRSRGVVTDSASDPGPFGPQNNAQRLHARDTRIIKTCRGEGSWLIVS